MTALIQIRELNEGELEEIQSLYDKTRDVRIRTRTQMILLAIEKSMTAPQIGQIVRKNDQTVRRWIRRFIKALLSATYDFFEQCNHQPEKVLSAIGALPS